MDNEKHRLSNYTYNYLIGNKNNMDDIERSSYHRKSLKEPIWATICYVYGIYDPFLVSSGYQYIKTLEFTEQIRCIQSDIKPKYVLDVGAGRGELTAALLWNGTSCIAVDPSPGSLKVIPDTLKLWIGINDYNKSFWNIGFRDSIMKAIVREIPVDTVVLCETLEHIEKEEVLETLPFLKELLRDGGRLIITNWLSYHPIWESPDGWDHITVIDDKYLDFISSFGSSTRLRCRSHMVVNF